MRLLFLTPQLPYPPMQGTSLRNFYLMRELARRHDVSLLTFLQPGDQWDAASPLHQICRAVRAVPAPPRRSLLARAFAAMASPLPDMALRLSSPDFARALLEWVEREPFDGVQVEGIEMAPYGLMLKRQRVRLVFDDHNAEYALQHSAFRADARAPLRWHAVLYSLIQWQKLACYERAVLGGHDAIAAVSDADARALAALGPGKPITVVPNGVDTEEYAPQGEAKGGACALVFTGKMDYRPNVDAALWFAEEILPRVRARLRQARFVIVGQQPHARLAALGRRSDVLITGAVPDVRPYIAGAAVYVAPLRMGSGTRLKLLQAMAMAAPVVSTTLGCDGLGVQDGREALLADSASAFADAVIRLAQDPDLRRALAARARQHVVEQVDWQSIAPRLEPLYAAAGGGSDG
ncbi:MAG: glycosyltransferase [Chloroflexi bacterium]|nr:glycosyltransferase [Chloroflexota bacterium]